MNAEQIKGLISAVLAAIGGGGAIGGWINNHLTVQVIGAALVLGVAAWNFWKMTRANMVAAVDKLPDVAGVITQPTPAGVKLAIQSESRSVAVAGSSEAAKVAKRE